MEIPCATRRFREYEVLREEMLETVEMEASPVSVNPENCIEMNQLTGENHKRLSLIRAKVSKNSFLILK